MNVSLTKELEKLVEAKVKTGRYHSASEVVREGLRLLEERDQLHAIKLEELREEIRRGLSSGRSTPLDIGEVKARVRKKVTRGKAPAGR